MQTIRVWNVATGQSISILRAHTHVVEFITFAPVPENETETKQVLLSGSRDNSVIVWELGNSTPISTLRGHDNWVRDGVILSGGKYAITCSDDHSMKIWDLSAGCCIKTIQDAHSHFVTCLRVNKRVPIVATGGVDRTVRLWQCT
jgi:platelet-activating factor acetylhydrolase IB subunit alpha